MEVLENHLLLEIFNRCEVEPNKLVPISRLRIVARAVVRENAVLGQVIGVPTRVTTVDNANLNAGEMMVDLGSDMFLTILNDSNYQRTLTIVRAN